MPRTERLHLSLRGGSGLHAGEESSPVLATQSLAPSRTNRGAERPPLPPGEAGPIEHPSRVSLVSYTSQRCPRCGHTEKANRPNRDHFSCRRCGLAGPADVVAGVNVRDRARSAWAFVTMPVPATA
ncbi:zinc ribbon domain-containing protein [Streptomyces sp. V4I23]|uniref:zinc ribbon domain-containing protein n=1 Tax=Streptomyces sp. V4I23 TaxID=3042282 RepID=UPI0027D804CD|nr:zinc ribbon domain-containing protein [Streptomyces sp. V4I23]